MSTHAAGHGLLQLDRLKALTDGVLTVVITIMVYQINIPVDHRFSEEGLLSFLGKVAFDLLIYTVSFWLVATYWGLHYSIFQYLRFGTRTLFWINLLFLLPVSLIPFVTKLKGFYPLDPPSIVIFGTLQIVCGACLLALWIYVASKPYLLVRQISPQAYSSMIIRLAISPILLSLLAIGVSFLDTRAGTIMFLSIPLFMLSHRAIDSDWSDADVL